MQWINRSLSTASALCRRYRHESRSNDLWTEILYVLQQLAAPLTELFVRRVDAARNDAQLLDANMAHNGLTVNDCWTSIELCTQLFYSLTSQDLPEFFEDNMQVWMNAFLQVGFGATLAYSHLTFHKISHIYKRCIVAVTQHGTGTFENIRRR